MKKTRRNETQALVSKQSFKKKKKTINFTSHDKVCVVHSNRSVNILN